MITIESTRCVCDSCNELKQGKIIVVSIDNYIQATESIQLCGECVGNLKYLLEVEE